MNDNVSRVMLLTEGFVIAAYKGQLWLTQHKVDSAHSFSFLSFFNSSVDLTILIRILRFADRWTKGFAR